MVSSMLPERLQRQKQQTMALRSNKAVAYIRVSTKDQVDNESIDTQRQRITQYADQNGLEIVKWFIEEGRSGKTVGKRPAVKDMLFYLARNKGKMGYAIFYKMQRSSRDVQSWASDLKSVLNGLGVAVRSATEHIDESPTGRFMEVMLVANGQLDNDIKSGVTSDNMASVAKQGWWQGGPIPGYDVVRVKIDSQKTHSMLRSNKHAPALKTLYERYSTGQYSKADIKRMANELGVRNAHGGYLNDTSVDRMLSQPAYMGYICNKHSGFELYEGKHIADSIVTPELFNKTQRVLALQSKSTNKLGKKKLIINSMYPLKRFIRCDNCGGAYRASAPLSGGGKSHSARYHCPRPQCKGIVRSRKADDVHNGFVELLDDITPSEGVLRLYKEILNRQALTQLGNLNKRIEQQRKSLSNLDAERLTALRSANNGQLTTEEKDELISSIAANKAEVIENIAKLEEQQQVKQSAVEYALNFMGDVKKLWVDADPDLKQRFQKMIFPDGVSLNTNNMTFGTEAISPLYRYVPNKKDLSAKEKSLLVTSRRIELLLPG